ncbi:MAG: acetyl-CoA carboxylase biotin carboxyl carrier protein [Parachlamydiaceae bacterium]|nr:acetyl-CoA carboxylase biotin carboxyl carrier protein [Parachlamydiaceae bacterium]
MELKHVKDLMAAMARSGTKKLTLKKEGFELELERGESDLVRSNDSSLDFVEEPFYRSEIAQRVTTPLSKGRELSSGLASNNSEKEDQPANYIHSPMVGTFYLSQTPGDPTFVNVGSKVEKNTVVCIIEAMKVMNEVKAGVTGTILEILVDDGHPVEFGTKLFRIS